MTHLREQTWPNLVQWATGVNLHGRWLLSAFLIALAVKGASASEVKLTNKLATAASPYLRDAARQPVAWYPWGEEPFRLAKKLNRPVLLDIGAIWCHWCHVMDEETYSNPEVARLINDNFIAIKVDRDERPDIDSRYQKAVHALTGAGGWSLTVFLNAGGQGFYGGGTFFPDDQYGRIDFNPATQDCAGLPPAEGGRSEHG
ncbi:MAG: DUF255 domain-containing protein [Candidatus Methylomirabilis oxyfera]|nr:DUF255 domain-containing protein [Candidatus Methylomirabilis oxyfera]